MWFKRDIKVQYWFKQTQYVVLFEAANDWILASIASYQWRFGLTKPVFEFAHG